MRSRTFLNVSLGILALMFAYHLGARSATAQAGSTVTGFAMQGVYYAVITATGDVYRKGTSEYGYFGADPPQFVGNFWGGATPTSSQESFGSLKVRYRGEREPQSVKPSTNR